MCSALGPAAQKALAIQFREPVVPARNGYGGFRIRLVKIRCLKLIKLGRQFERPQCRRVHSAQKRRRFHLVGWGPDSSEDGKITAGEHLVDTVSHGVGGVLNNHDRIQRTETFTDFTMLRQTQRTSKQPAALMEGQNRGLYVTRRCVFKSLQIADDHIFNGSAFERTRQHLQHALKMLDTERCAGRNRARSLKKIY